MVVTQSLGGIAIKQTTITMEKKRDSYNALMQDWKTSRPDYEEFSDDGVLVDEIWNLTSPKILFLLKEPNSNFINIRGKGYLPQTGNSHLFWRNINIWQYIIAEYWNKRTPSFDEIYKIKENEVNSIAYVNLKKCNDNNSTSVPLEIGEYVEQDKLFLQKQIELIDPEIIVCGRTMNYFNVLFNSIKITKNIFRYKNTLVIDFYHPACRKAYKTTFDLLSKVMSEDIVKQNISEIKKSL